MRLKITKVEKVVDEGGKEHLIVLDSNWFTVSNKDLRESLANPSTRVEFCSAAPTRFQLNTLYVRADRKVAWAYVLKEEENSDG